MARELGNVKAANMASLGILCGVCKLASIKGIKQAVDKVLNTGKSELKELNYKVLSAGYDFVKEYESVKR